VAQGNTGGVRGGADGGAREKWLYISYTQSETCHATAPSSRTLFALRSARRAGRVSPYPVCSQVTAHPNRTGLLHTSRAIT
jgi:hypothetical protein